MGLARRISLTSADASIAPPIVIATATACIADRWLPAKATASSAVTAA